MGRQGKAVSIVLGHETSCYDGWVAGTSYVPVPKAQEVYSLASLAINRAKKRVSAGTNLLSLRDPDV